MGTSVSNAEGARSAKPWPASDEAGVCIARCARSLEAMAVLSAIVETGSFARAAATLGITASAARSSISRLELRLGVKLLERTGSAPHLTQAGEVFHAHCLRILRAARDAHAAVATESYGLPTAS